MSAIITSKSASKHFQNRSAVLVVLIQAGLGVCGDGESWFLWSVLRIIWTLYFLNEFYVFYFLFFVWNFLVTVAKLSPFQNKRSHLIWIWNSKAFKKERQEVVLVLWRTELALNINEINKYAYKINEFIQKITHIKPVFVNVLYVLIFTGITRLFHSNHMNLLSETSW